MAVIHRMVGTAFLSVLAATSIFAEEFTPPPQPTIAPLIARTYPEDANQNGVADSLENKAASAQARLQKAATPESRAAAKTELDQQVEVQLVFTSRVTQKQIDDFVSAGGQITYMYRAVSYGWNGQIALNKAGTLPALMGKSLVFVTEAQKAQLHLDRATQTGRVRPVWVSGFAGSALGFDGDSNITIGILDTGVDASHTDLSGRQQYWQDFTPDGNASPLDMGEHGSHVTGIALGTGGASGVATGTLYCSDSGDLTTVTSGNFYPSPLDLPTTSSTYSSTARWLGGGSTSLYQVYHAKGTAGGWTTISAATSGASPITEANTLTALSTRAYSPALLSNGGTVTNYVVTSSIANYPAVGDGYNRLRGVAPTCRWAGAKVFTNAGSGIMTYVDSALDTLVANRVANNIKVLNISLGVIGDPGIDSTTRQKVNTAVNNGIVVCCSAGNDGGSSTQAQRQVDDPGRAAMAITIASSDDNNQLTAYSSEGFTSPGSVSGREEDYKPDIVAPGGSSGYYTSILSPDSNSTDGEGGFSDQRANDYTNMQGTSMASPFAAGCSALIIDAMQQQGITWDFTSSQHSRYVKMLLCATATETNANRESGSQNPTLQRASAPGDGYPAGKDMYEGYGLLNPDAAIEAVSLTYVQGTSPTGTLGANLTDRRAWARKVNLYSGWTFNPSLTAPAGGDFDLYLYSNSPTAYGGPTILASSTNAGNGAAEALNYTPGSNMTALLVVKRISGSGTFTLTSTGDSTGPSVTISAPSAATTRSGPITYTVTYADSQSGLASVSLAPGNITLNTTGTASGTVGVSGSGSTRTVTISSITGDGTLGISIAAGTATDNMGNTSLAAGPSATFLVDNTGPSVNISAPSASMTRGGPVTYTVSYADAGSGMSAVTLASGNITLNTTGTATGNVGVSGSGNSRTVTISSITGDGTLGISIAAGTATDNVGNASLAAGPSATFLVDNTGPSVTISAPSTAMTSGGPVTYTVSYADSGSDVSAVTLAPGNITLNTTGTASGTVGVSGSGNSRTVTISGITGDGTLGISIATGTATDNVGNTSLAAGPSATFLVDNTGPSVTVGPPSSSMTDGAPVTYTVSYADVGSGVAAITLAPGNITLNATGTASGTVGVSGSGNTRTVMISSITGNGTLGISVAAGTASDNIGNSSPAAGPSATFLVDNSGPTGTIVIDSGALWTGDADVTLTLTSSDGSGAGVTDMQFSNDGTNWSGWEAVGSTKEWTLASGDGAKTVYVQFRDTLGNMSTNTISSTIGLDTTPPTGTVTINAGAPWTGSTDVTLSLTSADGSGSGVTEMQFSNDGTSWTGWETVGSTKAWALDSGDGTKTVYAQFRDDVGNVSTDTISSTIGLDTTPPTGTVTINAGAPWTGSTDVTLSLTSADGSGSGVAEMQFSNDGTNWSGWETVGSAKAWILASGDGAKTVYAQFRDDVGNVSTDTISATIGLDTTPPTGTLVINGGALWTGTTDVTLALTSEDGSGSGVAEMQFSNDGISWSGWEAIGSVKSWTLTSGDGAKTVYAQFRDILGNVSTDSIYGTISLDTTALLADILLTSPAETEANQIEFSVTFNKSVGSTFTSDDVIIDGTLACSLVVEGTDPAYTVTLTPTDPDVDGAAGITIGTDIEDQSGHSFIGGSSPLCHVYNWRGFSVQPESAQDYSSDAHTFTVVPNCGASSIVYQWKWDDAAKKLTGTGELDSKIVHDGPTTPTWALTGLTTADSGDYWCEATYDGQTHLSSIASLQVEDHVAITQQPVGGTVGLGDSFSFSVTATGGYAPLHYQWKKDGNPIPGATDAEYAIPSVSEQDLGPYTVEISDSNIDVQTSAPALLASESLPVPGLENLGLALLAGSLVLLGIATFALRRNTPT